MWLKLYFLFALAVPVTWALGGMGGKFGLFSKGRSGRKGGFTGFFSSLRKKMPVAMCNFYSDQLPMSVWPEKSDICMPEDRTLFPYPGPMIDRAMSADPDAGVFLSYLTSCYKSLPSVAPFGTYATYRYQDVCPVQMALVDKVWRLNQYSNPPRKDVCYVVNPEHQNIQMAVCSTNCTLDNMSLANHFCIPDGFVEQTALVFCPWDIMSQCTPVTIRIPRGCSGKRYSCLNYA